MNNDFFRESRRSIESPKTIDGRQNQYFDNKCEKDCSCCNMDGRCKHQDLRSINNKLRSWRNMPTSDGQG